MNEQEDEPMENARNAQPVISIPLQHLVQQQLLLTERRSFIQLPKPQDKSQTDPELENPNTNNDGKSIVNSNDPTSEQNKASEPQENDMETEQKADENEVQSAENNENVPPLQNVVSTPQDQTSGEKEATPSTDIFDDTSSDNLKVAITPKQPRTKRVMSTPMNVAGAKDFTFIGDISMIPGLSTVHELDSSNTLMDLATPEARTPAIERKSKRGSNNKSPTNSSNEEVSGKENRQEKDSFQKPESSQPLRKRKGSSASENSDTEIIKSSGRRLRSSSSPSSDTSLKNSNKSSTRKKLARKSKSSESE